MRGNLLKFTAITCSSSPGVIKNGRLGALVFPELAKETGFRLLKLEVGSRGWLGVIGDWRDIWILSNPQNQLPGRTKRWQEEIYPKKRAMFNWVQAFLVLELDRGVGLQQCECTKCH